MDKEDVATFENAWTLRLIYVWGTKRHEKDLFDLIKKATFNNVNLFYLFWKQD